MRMLIAFEDEYRAYRGAISTAIQALRPRMRVETVGADGLKEGLARLDPQVVICSRAEGSYAGYRVAWVELPMESERAARVRLGERRFEVSNPPLEEVLGMIDEAERILRSNAQRCQL